MSFPFSAQLLSEVRQGLRDLDLLGTDRLAAPAADAGAGVLLLRHRHQHHGRNEAAAGEVVLIVEFQQPGDIQTLGDSG